MFRSLFPSRPRARLAAVAACATVLSLAPFPLLRASAVDPCPSPQFAPVDGDVTSGTCPEGPPPTTRPGDPTGWLAFVDLYADPALTAPVSAERTYLVPGPNGPTVIPAGSAPFTNGAVQYTFQAQPPGSTVMLNVHEAGADGPICRTEPDPAPRSGRVLRIVGGAPAVLPKARIDLLLSTFVRQLSGLPAGSSVKVTEAVSSIQGDGVHVGLKGDLDVFDPNTAITYHFTFDHQFVMRITPDSGPDLTKVLQITAPNPGVLTLAWKGTPPAQGDFLKAIATVVFEPLIRPLIPTEATPLVNSVVRADLDAQWFIDQHFTVSMRSIGYQADGIRATTSFCRLDP